MMIHALFVGLCFLCDEILMVLFPSDFLMQGLLFVSNMGFCAIMLTVRIGSIPACLLLGLA